MRCGLCHGDFEKLCKSHIIAKALHLFGQDDGPHRTLVVLPADEEKRTERSHAGFYSRIVCEDCEASFKAGDDALIEFCRSHADGVELPGRELDPLGVFKFPQIDKAALHRGIVTTLFRAHLSDNDFFKHVDLPAKFAEQLRQVLLSKEPTYQSDFDVALRIVPSLPGSVIMSPTRVRFGGVNAYWFTFPHVTAAIKVDGQRSPAFHRVRLGAHASPVAALTPDLNASEFKVMSKVLRGRHDDVVRISGLKVEKSSDTN